MLQNTLPLDAVVSWHNQTYAFEKTAPHTYSMIPVNIGVTGAHGYEVKNADSLQNKTLVLKGAYTLLMALKNISDED